MADKPFDRVIFNEREKPLSSDWNRVISEQDRTIRHMAKMMFGCGLTSGAPALNTPGNGFIGSGFWVRPKNPAAMQVVVNAGQGFIDKADVQTDISTVSDLDDIDSYKPLLLSADEVINVPAADVSNPRIDIIEVTYSRLITDVAARLKLNPGTGRFESNNLDKTLSWDLAGRSTVNGSGPINYKTGTPAGSPVAPATTTGYVKIGEVLVGTGVTTIAENKIKDLRAMLAPNGGAFVVGFLAGFNDTTPFAPANPTPTFSGLPPGMQAAVVGKAANSSIVYIIPGMTPLAAMATPWYSSDASIATWYVPNVSITTIGSGDQSDLAGAGAVPVLNVALGQPCIKISYSGFQFNEGTGQITALTSTGAFYAAMSHIRFTAGQMTIA